MKQLRMILLISVIIIAGIVIAKATLHATPTPSVPMMRTLGRTATPHTPSPSFIPSLIGSEQPELKSSDGWESINSLDMLSSEDGWAAGNKIVFEVVDGIQQIKTMTAALQHWNGHGWMYEPSPVDAFIYSFDMISPTDGWMAGYEGWENSDEMEGEGRGTNMLGNVFLHWDGHQWNTYSPPIQKDIVKIQMISSNEGWATAKDGILLRWDGVAWKQMPSPSKTTPEISMLSLKEGWAIDGTENIYHWNGFRWSLFPVPEGCTMVCAIYNLSMISAQDGWVSRWYQDDDYHSHDAIYRWDGKKWNLIFTQHIDGGEGRVEWIQAYSATNVWAGVWYGMHTHALIHWDGNTWQEVASSWIEYPRVSAISENEVWIQKGDSNLLYWNGTEIIAQPAVGTDPRQVHAGADRPGLLFLIAHFQMTWDPSCSIRISQIGRAGGSGPPLRIHVPIKNRWPHASPASRGKA